MLTYDKCRELKLAGFTQDIHLCYQIEENEYLEKKAKGTQLNPFHEEQLLIPTWARKRTKPVWWSDKEKEVNYYTCPSFEEIWAQLPKDLPKDLGPNKGTQYYHLSLDKESVGYWAQDLNGLNTFWSLYSICIMGNNITEAAADLWLLLKKEKLV